jgi:GNAT superfamily N-acetyltransferase
MRDIRPIKESEAPTFLHVLCDVFELDYSRAERVFFSEPLFDLNRKWALFDGKDMISILTTVPLEFGWGNAIGIAGVATLSERRREGLGACLLERVLKESKKNQEGVAYLFAHDPRLYERIGFSIADEVIRGKIDEKTNDHHAPILGYEEVRSIYDQWALGHADRLRRNERRWKYWLWNLRVCTAVSDGYVCIEGGVVRECVANTIPERWGIGNQIEWFGLKSMAEFSGLTVKEPLFDTYLMRYGSDQCPQMFLTDQF